MEISSVNQYVVGQAKQILRDERLQTVRSDADLWQFFAPEPEKRQHGHLRASACHNQGMDRANDGGRHVEESDSIV